MRFALAVSGLRISLLPVKNGVPSRLYSFAPQPQKITSIDCFKIINNEMNLSPKRFSESNTPQTKHVSLSVTLDEIQYRIDGTYISSFKTVLLLKEIKKRLQESDVNVDCLKQDERFKQFCETIKKNCYLFPPYALVETLKTLLIIGVDPQSPCIESIENMILCKVKELDVHSLLNCLSFHYCYVSTDLQKNVVKALTGQIQHALHDINFASALFQLIRCFQCFDKRDLRSLNLKLGELVHLQSPQNLCKVICILAEQSNRNKTLLDSISSYLSRAEWKPNIKVAVDVLYALKRLNFPDVDLLTYLTESRTEEITFIYEAPVISRLLAACGHLRWKSTAIIEACGKWIMGNMKLCSSREYVSYILSAAALNFTPENTDILKKLISNLNKETIESNSVWLDVVWSLAILDCVDKEMLQHVLTKDFSESLICGKDFRATNNKLKLMNLKAVMKNKYPECIFHCDVLLDSVEVPKSSDIVICKKSVTDALSNFIPAEKYLHVNHGNDLGFNIDAEFIMDANGKPLSLLKYGSKVKVSTIYKPLPQGSKRFALLVWTYKDYTLNEQTLTGANSLMVRLLKSQGYIVVQVPYEKFALNTTVVKQAHFLKQEIESAMMHSGLEVKTVKF